MPSHTSRASIAKPVLRAVQSSHRVHCRVQAIHWLSIRVGRARRATRAAGVVGGGMRRGAAGICPPKHFGCAGECDQGLFSVSRKTVQFADTFDSSMHIHVNGPAQLDSSTRRGDYETTRRRGNETTRQRDYMTIRQNDETSRLRDEETTSYLNLT